MVYSPAVDCERAAGSLRKQFSVSSPVKVCEREADSSVYSQAVGCERAAGSWTLQLLAATKAAEVKQNDRAALAATQHAQAMVNDPEPLLLACEPVN